MSSTENPIHAPLPSASAKRPPNQHGDELRIRLAGPLVDKVTLAELHVWRGRGISAGVTIDRLVAFAKAMGFDPSVGLEGAFTSAPSRSISYPGFIRTRTKQISPSAPKRRQG